MGALKHIYLLDDDKDFRSALREFLADGGYRITEFSEGEKLLQQCREELPDLVITDMAMPSKSGYEVIMALRKEFPRLKIMAMSGGARVESHDYLDLASTVGADRTMAKPFDGRALTRAVLELIGRGHPALSDELDQAPDL